MNKNGRLAVPKLKRPVGWIGKDVKIGKNVRIADNSIVGWGSIVTKRFEEPNVILAGIPAKVVKHGVNWDRKSINKYLKGL